MLEPRECLFIDRWRRALNQTDYGRRHGCAAETYRRYENGRNPVPKSWADRIPKIENLRPIERFVILRRRAGLTKEQLAKIIGCSCHFLEFEELELKHPSYLQKYWGDQSV